MRLPLLAYLAVSIALALPAAAQTGNSATAGSQAAPPPFEVQSTGDLVRLCGIPKTDPYHASAMGFCEGFGSGVLNYHLLDTSGANRRMRRVCFPQMVPTRQEAIAQFLTWAQAHPQYMDEPAPDGVMRFLMQSYPCGHRRG